MRLIGVFLLLLVGAILLWLLGAFDSRDVERDPEMQRVTAPRTTDRGAESSPVEAPDATLPASTGDVAQDRRGQAPCVTGRVSNTSGESVLGAEIRLSGRDDNPLSLVATSDAEGRFSFLGVAAGEYAAVCRAPGYEQGSVPHMHVPESGSAEGVDFVLDAGSSLSGSVVDTNGSPISGVRVCARPQRVCEFQKIHGIPYAVSSETGEFMIRGLPGGIYSLRASHESWTADSLRDLRAGQRGIVIVVRRLGGIFGRVTAREGPIPRSTRVHVRRHDGNGRDRPHELTPGDTRFEIPSLRSGTWEIWASGIGVATEPRLVEVSSGARTGPIELRLVKSGTLVGSVRGPDGKPVHVMLEIVARCGARIRLSSDTPVRGRFSIPALAPGEYTVRTLLTPWIAASEVVRIIAGQVIDVALEIPRGGALEIRVSDSAGTLLEGVLIEVRDADGEQVWSEKCLNKRFVRARLKNPSLDWEEYRRSRMVTDRAGMLILRNLPDGTYTVTCAGRAEAKCRATVEIHDGETVAVRLKRE
jgi:Carboxypeptidase regulatory-like domain